MSDPDVDGTLDAVGARLRRLRDRRGMTLAALAERTGVSVSTLSRLEAGRRRPTLEQLLPLAKAYGVTLDDLVGAPPTGDPRIVLRPQLGPDGSVILPLTRRPGGIQAYKFVLTSERSARRPEPRAHPGYEWIYVLNGSLRLILGDRDLVIEAGEAVEFDTRTPHWLAPSTGEPVEFLSLFGRQGERAHVRGVEPDAEPDSDPGDL